MVDKVHPCLALMGEIKGTSASLQISLCLKSSFSPDTGAVDWICLYPLYQISFTGTDSVPSIILMIPEMWSPSMCVTTRTSITPPAAATS